MKKRPLIAYKDNWIGQSKLKNSEKLKNILTLKLSKFPKFPKLKHLKNKKFQSPKEILQRKFLKPTLLKSSEKEAFQKLSKLKF